MIYPLTTNDLDENSTGKSDEDETGPLSATIIMAVLIPFIVIIAAGLFVYLNKRNRQNKLESVAPLRENENAIENQHPHERSGITNKQGVDTIESTAELVESSLQSELSAAEAITAKNLVVSNSLSISTEKVEDKNAIRKKIERLILRIVPNELSECDRRYLLSHLTFLNSF